ncbi:MAG: helix-turn-helix transcriptional regulator [Sulfuricurvum sp.]|nr:helix-turn-helix transcriptional regulator [Sulfuricurvum sp.]
MTKKEISEILGIDQNTIKNWERNRPQLHKIVMDHFENNPVSHDLNDKEYLKNEINKAIDGLPQSKAKKFYHLIMAELSDFE